MTTAELATGLALLAVLGLMASPVISEILANYHLRGATQQIFSELQRARLAAVMGNHPFRFYVDDGSTVYHVHDDSDRDYLEDLGEVSSYDLERSGGGVQLASSGAITFLANGTTLSGGTITVANSRGITRTIAVTSGGSVRIQ